MAEIRITADMEEAVRSTTAITDAATKGAKTAADAVGKVGDAWTAAGVKSTRVLKEQEAMLSRMVMRADQAAAAARRQDFDQRRMVPFQQGAQSVDARVSSANIDLAQRRHQADISAAIGDATIDAAKNERLPGIGFSAGGSGVVGELTSKFAGLVTVTGGLTLAMAALNFVGRAQLDNRKNAGELATDLGQRRKQLGKDAASMGLSQDQINQTQTAGTLTTIAENEQFMHDVAASEDAKVFGMPKAGAKAIMGAFDVFKRTGNRNIAGVFGMPQAVPGNIEMLIKQRLAQDAGKPNDLDNAENNYVLGIPAEGIKEDKIAAGLSATDNKNGANRYDEGNVVRVAESGRNLNKYSGLEGNALVKAEERLEGLMPWATGLMRTIHGIDYMTGKNAGAIPKDELAAAIERMHAQLKTQTGIMLKPPKPGRRQDDQ